MVSKNGQFDITLPLPSGLYSVPEYNGDGHFPNIIHPVVLEVEHETMLLVVELQQPPVVPNDVEFCHAHKAFKSE